MRYLFALMLLSLGLGAILNASEITMFKNEELDVWAASPVSPTDVNDKLVVDLGADPEAMLPCTDDPGDCSLRSAIERANQDGVPTEISFSEHLVVELSRPLPPLEENDTSIKASVGTEVHIDGNSVAGTLFVVTGSNIRIEGLRLYGASANASLVKITGAAQNTLIARNIIGDDDAPLGNCGQSGDASVGIHVVGESASGDPQAWITSNIIECISGAPGVGVLVESGRVVMGKDSQGRADQGQRNIVRLNQGHGIYLGDSHGNVICNNLIHDNRGDGLSVSNFNNDILDNTISQ